MLLALKGLQGLYIWVIFTPVLIFTVSADVGCQDWSLSGDNDVCCKKCKPGNRLVERCGSNPAKLCTPCQPGTYITSLDYRCYRCTQCIGAQFTLKNCTSSSDTICGCKAGLRCGDKKCSFCVKECKKGEEPTGRDCSKCPEGKFNDKIHSMCKECTKSCPDGQTLKKGNSTCDNMCMKAQDAQGSRGIDREQQDNSWLPVMIAAGMAGFATFCIIALVVAYVKAKNKTEKPPKRDTSEEDVSTESGNMVVEQEEYRSFRHPEQEQGGSSDSINSENSDSKLIV